LEVLVSFKHAVHYLCRKGISVYLDELIYSHLHEEFHQDHPYYFGDYAKVQSSKIGRIYRIDNSTLGLIDLIITFGGDGLLMHCNTLFESSHAPSPISIPPTMSFDFGSLGFLAPFQFENFEREVRIFIVLLLTNK
jgi:NAD kinase